MRKLRYVPVLALFALAGCGGSHGGSAAASASASANAQDTAVKFAACMRQHGVEVSDPKPGDPGVRMKTRLNETQMNAAMKACQQYRPKGALDPDDPKAHDQMLKTAQCLRQHGVDVADPQPGKGIQLHVTRGDTKVQKAIEACDKLVPKPSGAVRSPANGG
ncbi:hypothetical protein [Actinomadura sp. DC4]|uniref:hypothetical protein n=1 Tax=Actinomadura sp. DC4 TaxID=3055069 RepID=UPI0025B04915|nr:hypothetical protein [Actinomadura sp. DC4]MDN3352640.1 hypothetical protein [Actinomadura sp. DC4]